MGAIFKENEANHVLELGELIANCSFVLSDTFNYLKYKKI